MKTYTKNIGTIKQVPGWFIASFNVKAGIISKDFRSIDAAQDFLKKHNRF